MLNWQTIRERIFGRNKKLDRVFYGPEGPPKLSRRYRTVLTSILLVMLVSGWIGGYIHGYTEGTGLPPFVRTQEAAVPPDIEPTTAGQVEEFLDTHDVSDEEYGIGFSCVEYALEMARKSHWEGISSRVIWIDFLDEEIGHLILGFPTEDAGWVYVEPQANTRIYPRVGGMWLDKEVCGIYYHVDGWIPIEVAPDEEVQE